MSYQGNYPSAIAGFGLFADSLRVLIGLKLTTLGFAADMRTFGFGTERIPLRARPDRPERLVAPFALHLQCPWRLQSPTAVVTGSGDWYERNGPEDYDEHEMKPEERLQQALLRVLLRDDDTSTSVLTNQAEDLIVSNVKADPWGGFEINLTPDYVLAIFPSGTRREQWRYINFKEDRHVYLKEGIITSA